MFKGLLLATVLLGAIPPSFAQVTQIELSIIKTSEVSTLEALTYSGGDYTKLVKLQHVAVLVRHNKETFLFDTGLGRQVDAQFKADMPLWARLLFSYGPVSDARSQLDAAGFAPIKRIILSHGHWDHASGLVDFPQAEVWLSQQEKDYLAERHYVSVFPSQISAASIQWKPFQWEDKPYGVFPRSLDLFGDASVVLVPLTGHTPGSIGMYVSLQSGKKFLFVGDAVWKADAVPQRHPKMWISSSLVDSDKAQALRAVEMLADIQDATPGLVIVPAHDAAIHDAIGAYFPRFLK